MNNFLRSTLQAVHKHGVEVIYNTIDRLVDEITGEVIDNTMSYSLKMYPKHTQSTQYNYPALVGKELIMFYLPNYCLPFKVKNGDTITHNGTTYRISTYQEHVANGEVCLFRILGTKG